MSRLPETRAAWLRLRIALWGWLSEVARNRALQAELERLRR